MHERMHGGMDGRMDARIHTRLKGCMKSKEEQLKIVIIYKLFHHILSYFHQSIFPSIHLN